MPRFKLLLAILFALVHMSCASFPQNQLPRIDHMPVISEYKHRPSAYITVSFRINDKGPAVAAVAQGRRIVQTIADKVTREADIFEEFTFDRSEMAGKEYIISIDLLNHGNESTASLKGMLFGLSLGTIPIWVTDNYTLNAKVFNATGKLLAEYRFDDSLRTYFHLFLLFSTKKRPANTSELVLSNMIRNFYKKLYDEKIIQFGDEKNYTCLDCGRTERRNDTRYKGLPSAY